MAKLHFYYAAMNAGKSTTLLQSNYNYQERGMHTVIFSPSIDNRFASGKVSSRIGLSADAYAFEKTTNLLFEIEKLNQIQQVNCIFIDEAQFLTKDQVHQLTEIVDNMNIPVIAYGLRSDYMGEPFEGSLYLMTLAEDIAEIKTICHCGRKATMNIRIDSHGNKIHHGDQVLIGGNETYVSTCRKHYKQGVASSD